MIGFTRKKEADPERSLELTSELFTTFRCGKVFSIKPTNPPLGVLSTEIYDSNSINGNVVDMSFHESGDWLLVGTASDSIHLIDCLNGTVKDTIHMKKSGVGKVAFTHHANTFIASSSKTSWTEGIRYTSLYDHRDLRYFKGHRGEVLSLCMSKTSDTFISSAKDNTVRLWDLRSPLCQGLVHTPGPAVVAVDPQSTVFAVACPGNCIMLLDRSTCEQGAFATFTLDGPLMDIHSIAFAPDGAAIVVTGTVNQSNPNPGDVNKDRIMIIDSFEGKTLAAWEVEKQAPLSPAMREAIGMQPVPKGGAGAGKITPENPVSYHVNASMSADSKFVSGGTSNGSVLTWKADTGDKVGLFTHDRQAAVTHALWSPARLMLASADASELALWIPVV